ncbi:MAG: hypothetical protein IKX25_10365 [Bacteroidales bacterium]|nr:hypothetical protein [Bacteroidales bacterium]
MRRKFLAFLALSFFIQFGSMSSCPSLFAAPVTIAKKTTQQRFPDGTVIDPWFLDVTTPQLADLGAQYRLDDYGLISSPYLVQTEAIQQLIDRASADGGGVIVVPEGIYKSGALHFRQGVNLYLSRGAVLLGSEDIYDFPIQMTRIEGEWCKYFPALINVESTDGFTLCGEGTVDGNGSTYWRNFRLRREWNPKCTNKDEQRPRLFYAEFSTNVTIAGVTLQNSPFWTSHFYKCDHVKILGVRYFSPNHPIASASTDGIDLDATSYVLVKGCSITVNDDAICFKGGKYPDAPELEANGPCENILVEETSWNSSITCGSECLGARNILVRNCTVDGSSHLLQLKMRPDTPQHYHYITYDNVNGYTRDVLRIASWRQFFDLKGRTELPRSYADHITFRNCNLEANRFTNVVAMPEEYDLADFTFSNFTITSPDTTLNRAAFKSGLVEQNVTYIVVPRMAWPEVTRQTKPWTRWWWLGAAYDTEDVRVALQQYAEVGLGGLEVTNIYGVQGEEMRFKEFLSPEWVDLFCYTLDEAKRHDLGIDLANASGWPFGGPWIYGDLACKTKVPRVWHVKSGERLAEKVKYHQEPMIKGYNVPDINEVQFPLYKNTQLQQWGLEQIRAEKDLPLIILTANGPDGQVIDLTSQVQTDGTLDWVAPSVASNTNTDTSAQDDWILTALFLGDHGKLVERAGPGGEGDVMDHFSREACLTFLSKFDEAFRGRDISYLRYYFNDSYEVDDARGMSDWTTKMFDEFEQRMGYDLRQHLPALLGQDTPAMNNRVTYDFRQVIEALVLEKYTMTWSQWAKEHGKGIRNQAHGSPANILDLYAVADVPEIEGRDLISIKAAPSAAHLTGKQLVSCEGCTWLNEHFLGTLGDAKQAIDLFFLGGVNHVFYHGTCFSPVRAQWPGWMFYAAAHFEPNNPWWGDFRHLNEYVTRTQSWLQQGRADTDVLVYYNITDMQAAYDERRPLRHYAGLDREMQESNTRRCIEQLDRLGFCWDMVSDRQIQQFTVDSKGNLCSNTLSTPKTPIIYKAILVPYSRQLPYETICQLYRLAEAGAKVIFERQLPNDVVGLKDYAQRNAELHDLAQKHAERVTVLTDISKLSIDNVRPETSLYSQQLLCHRRILDDGSEVYFIANRSGRDFAGTVGLAPAHLHDYAAIFHPMTGAFGKTNVKRTTHTNTLFLQLAQGESLIVVLHDQRYLGAPTYTFYAPKTNASQRIEGPWQLTFIEGGPELPASRTLSRLVSWTELEDSDCRAFSGVAEYVTTLPAVDKSGRAVRLSLGRVCNNASVYLNGSYVGTVLPVGADAMQADDDTSSANSLIIPNDLFRGNDVLTIRVANGMGNRIADLERKGGRWQKFYNINVSPRRPENRRNGVFSAIDWEPQPSGLLGPVTITPMKIVQ